MSKTYRAWNPDQEWLLPPSPREWLPEGDVVYFLLDVVAALDLSAITRKYEQEERGQPPFHPRMMVCVLLYAYGLGIYSSRRIERACQRDAAFRVIVGADVPNFRTISDFRKLHLAELERLFVQVLTLCAAAGLVKVGLVAVDGTKVKANASRHKAMSYERIKQEEERLQKEVADLLAKAQATDDMEDQTHGPGRRGDELPDELAHRQSRLTKIREAKAALEEQAKVTAWAEQQRRDAEDATCMAAGQEPRQRGPINEQPDPKDQHNFTDPQSGIMKVSNKGFDQCDNAQAVVNAAQIILAADVVLEPNDKQEIAPMIGQARANIQAAGVGERIAAVDADAGYYSQANVEYLESHGIEAYVATERLRHHEQIPDAPRGPIPKGLSAKQRMARKLRTHKGRRIYARRKGMVEPVFGQIKQARGFRQFLLRGLDKVRGEWSLVCMTHNILKLFASQRRTAA